MTITIRRDLVTHRFWVIRQEELPERHQASYRAEGINPDDIWDLIFSYTRYEDALACLANYENRPKPTWKVRYRVIDRGDETTRADRHEFAYHAHHKLDRFNYVYKGRTR